MQSVSKRELFIESFNVYKKNVNFLINIGFLMFTIQIIVPSLSSSLVGSSGAIYILYQVGYMILSTGISLGIIIQMLRMIRGGEPESISHIFGYFHKIPANLLGSFIIISSFALMSILFFMVILGVNMDLIAEMDFEMMLGENPSGLIIGMLIGFGIMIVYLSIKTHFFIYFIMDKNLGPLMALKKSFLATNGLEAELFIIWSLLACLNLMGAVLYMLGLLFTLPFTMIVISLIYNKYLYN